MTLAISEVSKRYGGLLAVSSISFEAMPGQITSVIGPNGAGKTTLLNLVSGTVMPDSGFVRLFDTDVTHAEPHIRAHKGLARTYQTPQLFEDMTVLDTVKVGAHQGALNVAQGAQFAAAGSLVEALNHLGLAILNGGFTSEQVQTCLERLEAGDLQAAEAAAASAADFARESDAQADETNIAAVATADHAGAAGAQIQISAGAANFYNDKSSTGWHAQVVSAQNDATPARSAAVGAAEAN